MKEDAPKPWYRERWPWIVMSGPAIVVVAGIATAVIAIVTQDTLVTEDYYRKGLNINRQIACAHEQADIRAADPHGKCRSD